MYWSVLKREHLLILTFSFWNDFNLYYIKFARFCFLLETEMAMNVFFFPDETINKLYISYGKYNFFQQVPQIVYSTIVSNLIEVIICFLSLTDKYYYEIKALTKNDKKKIFDIIKCVKKKLVIFFICTFILFLFYMYLITAFCAVYENTQLVFIKDSMFSFLLSQIYPFILYGISSLLRLISIKCKCCELKFLYIISDIFPIF